MPATQRSTAIRSYRIYFRDASNAIERAHEVDLGSDEDARELAALMLDEGTAYSCAEVWDRTRLVCTVRREGRVGRSELWRKPTPAGTLCDPHAP